MDKRVEDIRVTVIGVRMDQWQDEIVEVIVAFRNIPLAEVTAESIKHVLLTPGVDAYCIRIVTD